MAAPDPFAAHSGHLGVDRVNLDGVLVPVYYHGVVGAWAVVDEEDYERVATGIKWLYSIASGCTYRAEKTAQWHWAPVGMHRFVLGLSKGDPGVVHHRNEAPLDNRKANLLICENASRHASLRHSYRDYWARRLNWDAQEYDRLRLKALLQEIGARKKVLA